MNPVPTLTALVALAGATLITPANAMNAEEIADAVVEVYVGTLSDTAALLADQPPAADVREAFTELKATSIRKLVALGRRVEAMSDADRAVVERAVNSVNAKLQYDAELKPIYTGYAEAANHYFKADRAFFKELQSINILTQYAFFDLLRKQEPDEAERLGV